MTRPWNRIPIPTWWLVAGFALTIAVIAPATAHAAVTVSRAEVSSGTLRLEGRAAASKPITVDGVAMGTSDSKGDFRISRSSYTSPPDCTVDVNDGSATPASARLSGCTVSSTPPPPSTSPTILPDVASLRAATVGQDYNTGTYIISFSTETGPIRWEVISGALPAGLSIVVPEACCRPSPPEQQNYMYIDGIPTTAGTSTFTLRATDANGATATRTYSLTVNPASTLDFVMEDETYVFPLEVGTSSSRFFYGSGGVLPYRWDVAAGTLPPGMSLIQDDPRGTSARISGTPTTAGSYNFSLRLTDAQATTVTKGFTFTIGDGTLPAPTSLTSLTLNPSTVTGGASSTGTVTLGSPAPSQGGFVSLSSSNTQAATVPDSVTVPAGATTATFPVSTTAVTSGTTASISAVYGGVTRTATLTVNAAATTTPDTVTIGRAEYDSGKRTVRVEATSNRTGATLRAYVTSSGALIGTLSGGGGTFSVASNPQSITVKSSLGGSATRTVTVK